MSDTGLSDTAPIRKEERFDTEAVSAFLTGAIGDLASPLSFEQFPGGRANLTYLAVDAGGRELVLRRPPLGDVAPGSHDMGREHQVLSVLWEAFPQAPRALAFCDDETVMGKPFFVMERHRGTVIREEWPFSEVDKRQRTATTLIDTLAALHQVDYTAIGLSELGKPDGFVQRQAQGWTRRWHRAKTRDLIDMDAASAMLVATPAPQAAVLLHNDFKLDNTMVDDAGTVTSVFDWDMATLGDPLVDLGTALAYWANRDSPTYPVFGETAAELGKYLSPDDAAALYAAATGFDIEHLDWYLGLAYFRIAVIIEQIFSRFVAGQTTDERFAGLGDIVPALAAAATAALA